MIDNQKKVIRGRNAFVSLENTLKLLREKKYVTEISTPYNEWTHGDNTGYHLYAPFIISLFNGERWGLFSTTSYRSDRMKGTHWDSFLLKKYRGFDHCYLIIADQSKDIEVSEQDAKKADEDIQRSYIGGKDLDELDGAMTASELYDRIRELYLLSMPHGVREDKDGNDFEKRIVGVLNFKGNLDVWNGDELQVGQEWSVFSKLLMRWGCPHDVRSIAATTNIPKLPSGGLPKTDVLAVVTYGDGTEHRFTISCKNSRGDFVSCHQYPAKEFIRALGITDELLKSYIELFQRVGSERNIEKIDADFSQKFTKALHPYVYRLCQWVITGEHGQYTSKDQVADYVLAFSKESLAVELYSSQDYIQRMLRESRGQFGTPFKWTYASGRKGQDIQLKMPTFKVESPHVRYKK